jgi:hypothetical protein
MLELGGFNEALYPNEENALMDELQKRGGKLLYDPLLPVQRRPRSSLKSFAKMLKTYGRGRAEQFRLHPTFGSAPNFVPPLFCVYLLAILIAFIAKPLVGELLLIPLAFYAVLVAGQAMALMTRGKFLHSLGAIPLMVLTHILYGLGFWRGLFTTLKPSNQPSGVPVVIEKVPLDQKPIAAKI